MWLTSDKNCTGHSRLGKGGCLGLPWSNMHTFISQHIAGALTKSVWNYLDIYSWTEEQRITDIILPSFKNFSFVVFMFGVSPWMEGLQQHIIAHKNQFYTAPMEWIFFSLKMIYSTTFVI